MEIVFRILGGIIVFFGIWGLVMSYKMRYKIHMKLFRMELSKYVVTQKNEYKKAQNITLFLLSAFLINMGLLGLYGYPWVLLVVAVPLFNVGFSMVAKKYVRMKK